MKPKGLALFVFIICYSICFSQGKNAFQVYVLGNTTEELFKTESLDQNAILNNIDWQDPNSAIIFLGDKFLNAVIANPEFQGDQPNAALSSFVENLKNYSGEVYFIHQNDNFSTKEKEIEALLNRGDVYIPDDHCPGPEVKTLRKGIKLVAMSSEWWLEKSHEIAKGCRNQNEFQVIQELKEILDKHDDKFVLLALYHPLIANGHFSGHIGFSEHFVPLPILGSTKPFFRKVFGESQFLSHPDYSHFINEVQDALKEYKNVVVLSAHEKNLQYFHENDNHYIVSGSISEKSALPSKTDAIYSGAKLGFARLDFLEEGALILNFLGIEGRNLFQHEIIQRPPYVPNFHGTYDLTEKDHKRCIDTQYKKGLLHRLIFGKAYRKDWSTEVSFPSINLSQRAGGLRPVKLGGGKASTTIRLENENGKQFVLRSVKKEVSNMLPEAFRNSLIQRVYQDQIAGSQPFAALTVPPLAEAAGVYHTNPEIVYLPQQAMLGEFNISYANEIYLFEERPTRDHKDDETIVDSRKIISYSKMLKKIQSSSEHQVRQKQVLRSRLFDILLGDWDRHDDQWRWAAFEDKTEGKKKTFYEPIPRDRDQVFYKFDGLGPFLAKFVVAESRKQQSFKPKIGNVNYLGYQARHFDRSFLNSLSEESWISMAEELKSLITDETIDDAISRLPSEIQELNREYYKKSLRTRRNDLPLYAAKYYKFLSKYVDVVGTDKREHFEVIRNSNNTLSVVVHRLNKENQKKEIVYDRLFKSSETKEVRLFGLDGKDQFELYGEQDDGPLIRVIGGDGKDQVRDASKRKKAKKGVWLYDTKEGNEIQLGEDTKDRRSDNYVSNHYHREEYYFPAPGGLILFGFNPNDGLNIASSQVITSYGFHKVPFNAKHSLNFAFAFGSGKLDFAYELQLKDVIGSIDLNLQTSLSLPSNVNHYFGQSNEFKFRIEDFEHFDDLDYFKYNQQKFFVKPSIQIHSIHEVHDIRIGPYFEFSNLMDNEEKFVRNPDFSDLESSSFDFKHYFGIDVEYTVNKVDDNLNPSIGALLEVNSSYNVNLLNTEEKFLRIKGDLSLYNLIWLPKPLVLASKISAGINYGEYSFFQAHYAGYDDGLRAFRQNRFGGKSSFIFANDLRMKLFKVQGNVLPFSVGLIGSYDIGRVWNKNEISDSWHNSYGGGFWINILDVMPISFYYMTSDKKESSFIFKTGFGI